MEHPNSAPVLITGGARRIGLALARAFLQRGVPVIIAYRSEYPAMAELKALGACCIQGDFSTHEGIYRFADRAAGGAQIARGDPQRQRPAGRVAAGAAGTGDGGDAANSRLYALFAQPTA